MRSSIFEEIDQERQIQDDLWGTQFDNQNTVTDWVSYFHKYLYQAAITGATTKDIRTNFIKIAAIAVAAIETLDRQNCFMPTHYNNRDTVS